jgi:hypothetical protein
MHSHRRLSAKGESSLWKLRHRGKLKSWLRLNVPNLGRSEFYGEPICDQAGQDEAALQLLHRGIAVVEQAGGSEDEVSLRPAGIESLLGDGLRQQRLKAPLVRHAILGQILSLRRWQYLGLDVKADILLGVLGLQDFSNGNVHLIVI